MYLCNRYESYRMTRLGAVSHCDPSQSISFEKIDIKYVPYVDLKIQTNFLSSSNWFSLLALMGVTKVYIATQVAALEVWGRLNCGMGILVNSRHQPRIFPKLTRSIFPSHTQANKWEYDIFMECKKFKYRLKHFHIWKIILFLPYYNVKQYELIGYLSCSLSSFQWV